MLEVLGERQQALLKLLLKHKEGLTITELSQHLHITRNAVRQHLASLENEKLLTHGITRPTAGRPEQLYQLTDAGREIFPRHYSWFAQLVVESLKDEVGENKLGQRFDMMGKKVAQQLRIQHPELKTRQQKVQKMSEIMESLGYSATTFDTGTLTIEADNCVFHKLAIENLEICQFDLALLSTFTDSSVEHEECMAKGGHHCRFKFSD